MAAFVLMLLAGWLYGDPWLWTVLRAVAVLLTLALLGYLYAAESPLRRTLRVLCGIAVGAFAAALLHATVEATLGVALIFGAVFVALDYWTRRELASH